MNCPKCQNPLSDCGLDSEPLYCGACQTFHPRPTDAEPKGDAAELKAALETVRVFVERLHATGGDIRLPATRSENAETLCSIAHYAEYHLDVIDAALAKVEAI